MIGSSFAHYTILDLIGRGGMGEVYRARDSKLGRDVALKLLPPEFATDTERSARFQREARTLASLNHPNIAAIYGVDESNGRRFLVMELVDGEDLAQRLARGALPLDEALEIARQVGDGLEEAHEHGIIHRDLKPANIKLAANGTVKILDFGLARAYLGDAGSEASNVFNSPTTPLGATVQGTILGTIAYMSPEQARGRPVDRRADLWAFGVILFEMLSGRPLFAGDTVSDTLAAVLKSEPDWGALPPGVPPAVRRVLQRCLAKDPRQRMRSAADAALELQAAPGDEHGGAPSATPARRAARWTPWVLAAALLALVAVLAQPGRRGAGRLGQGAVAGPDLSRAVRAEIALPIGERATVLSPPAISPDGRWLVYGKRDTFGVVRLWLRSLERFDAELLPELEDGIFPFWSPDSKSIAYAVRGSLRRLDLATRATSVICDTAPWARGGSWNAANMILFAPDPNSAIHLIPATGGEARAVTAVDTTIADASHRFPTWLPDGEHFLFTLWSNNPDVLRTRGGIYAASIQGGPVERVLPDASSCIYLSAGYLLLCRGGRMVAVPFDAKTRQPGTAVVPIDAQAMFGQSMGVLAASASTRGDLAYAVGEAAPPAELAWCDANGQVQKALGLEGSFTGMALSPDGSRLAVERSEGMNPQQIWIVDLSRGTMTPLTHSSNDSYGPVWAPDGERVAYSSRDSGNEDLYVQSANGTAPRELLHGASAHDTQVTDWSADGRYLLFDAAAKSGGPTSEVWVHDFEQHKAHALLSDGYRQHDGRLSPDGHWLAYVSDESGRPEIYLRPFPALDRKWQVSTAGGSVPHWRKDARELFFVEESAHGPKVMAAQLDGMASGNPTPGVPREQFAIGPQIVDLTPTTDHARFLVAREVTGNEHSAIRLILDWTRELAAR